MPIHYDIDTDGVIHETWSGEVRAADLEAHWRSYREDPHVLATRRTLVDLRQSTILFSGDELLDLIDRMVVPFLADKPWRTALLVNDPLQFGVSRQYQAFAELYSQDAIFRDRDEACAWLLRED